MATSRAKSVANLTVHFTLEKETKNMVRFREDEEGRNIGTLYMDQEQHKKLGAPGSITVIVTAR